MTTVLVTSIGSGVGHAILTAAENRGAYTRVFGVTTPPVNAGASRADGWTTVPPIADADEFATAFLAVAERSRPSLVLPGRDDDVAVLARLREPLEAIGARCPGPPDGLADQLRDKQVMSELLRAAGVNFCRTAGDCGTAELLLSRTGGPLVIKPRRGDGSRGVKLAHSVAEIRKNMGESDIAQPFLTGRDMPNPRPGSKLSQDNELSAQCVLLPNCTVGPFVTRNRLDDGVPTGAEVVDEPLFADQALRVARSLRDMGVSGPVNVQGRVVDETSASVFEVNVRCTGLTGARAKLGFNEVALMLDHWSARSDPVRYPSCGSRILRFGEYATS